MCKRIIPLISSLIFVTHLSAQDFRNVRFETPLGRTTAASARVPCADNEVGTIQLLDMSPTSQSNSTPTIGEVTYLCFNDSFRVDHLGDFAITSDPNAATMPGVGYATYTCPPDADLNGPSLTVINTDPCLFDPPGVQERLIAVDFNDPASGDATFRNIELGNFGATLQSVYNNGEPVQFWFAPITYDGLDVNGNVVYEGNPSGPCVSVNAAQAFSVVYLNPIGVQNDNVTYPFGGIDNQARFQAIGGLPEFDNTVNYTFDIVNVANPSITGTVINGPISHGDFPIVEVPSSGTYRVTISDGRGCSFEREIVMDQVQSNNNNPIEFIIQCPDGITAESIDRPIPITSTDFDSIIGVEFGLCWDPMVFDYVDFEVIDNQWLIGDGASLTDNGSVYVSFFATDIFAGQNYPDGVELFKLTLRPTGVTGNTSINFCTTDPRPGSNNPPEITPANEDNPIAFPILIENECPNIEIVDPNDVNVIVNNQKNACPSSNNGSIDISAFGGTGPYQVTLTGENGFQSNTEDIAVANDFVTFDSLAPGKYEYFIQDSRSPSPRFKQDTIEILEANLGVSIVEEREISCDEAADGILRARVSINGSLVADEDLSNYSFTWINDRLGDTVSNQIIAEDVTWGAHEVYVTSENGCQDFARTVLTDPDPITFQPSQDPASCSGVEDGNAAVNNVAGGTGPYAYEWENGVTGNNNLNITAGKYAFTVTDSRQCEVIDTVIVGATNEFRITQDLDPINCFGIADGRLDISRTIVSGTESDPNGWSYQWSNNVTNIETTAISSVADSLGEGTYSVTVTNSALPGCFDTASFTLIQPDSLFIESVDVTPVTSCMETNGAATANVMGGTITLDYQYFWDTMDVQLSAAQTANDLASGPIMLTVEDNNGCIDSMEVIIGTPPPPQVQFFDDVSLDCSTDRGRLEILAVPGRQGVNITQYQWSHDASIIGSVANDLQPDTFIVAVIDEDMCSTVDTAIVSAPPAIQTSLVDIAKEPCFGIEDGELNIGIVGGVPNATGNPYTIEWTPAGSSNVIGTSENLTGVTSGDYDLFVVDANDCPFDTTITLTSKPQIEISFDETTKRGVACFEFTDPSDCNGFAEATANYADGSAGTFTFIWQTTSETSATPTTSFSSDVLCAGMQALRVSDGECETVDSVNIPSPDEIVLQATTEDAVCFGENNGEAQISATGGDGNFTFTWPDGSNDAQRTDLVATTYVVSITDGAGCSGQGEVAIDQPETALNAVIDPDNTNNVVCAGDNDGRISLIVTGGNDGQKTFVWTNNVSSIESAAGLSPDNYTIEIIDINGCSTTASYEVEAPNPITAAIDFDPIQCFGFQTGIRIQNPTGGNGTAYTFSVNNSPARPFDETITDFGGSTLISLFDETGCRQDTMVEIPQPRELMVDFADNLAEVDLGGQIGLDLNVSGDAPVESIFWTVNGGQVDSTFLCSTNPCTNPTVRPLNNTVYTAFVTDTNGCMREAAITVTVDKNRNVYIPNVFAPNNAGFDTNDRFEIFTGSGVNKINYAKVFNRWGTMVADLGETQPNTNGITIWDGLIKGERANQGVYVYLIEVEFIDLQPGGGRTTLLYRGDVTLLR
ncbi:MAG: gliding motility-associated C-terminal domain-containing protein [Bacteroidota bacterium]